MKRCSIAFDPNRGRNEGRRVGLKLIHHSGPSISDLPSNLLENIILRLPVKRIFVCKSVCKTWNDIISDPAFAKLHCDQGDQIYFLIHSCGPTYLSRMLYLVQPEQEDFEQKLDMCGHCYNDMRCFCHVKVKLDTKFKLPLCNFEKILKDRDAGSYELSYERGRKREGCLKLKMKDHRYKVVNSCNGLLCLSDRFDNDPLVVCNPFTGEFINLPDNKTAKHPELCHIDCGFGFSPRTNQYKVIRMFLLMVQDDVSTTHKIVAEVHILGTNSWRNIGLYCYSTYKLFPTYLNGCIYWFSERGVISFDVETERFASISLPPLKNKCVFNNVGMGLLGGEFCIAETEQNLNFWLLTGDGASKGWVQFFSIDLSSSSVMWPRGSYQPIKFLNGGAILAFHSHSNGLFYIDPCKIGYKYLKVRGLESKLEAIPHIPSFVSLRSILSGSDVEVLNVKSRCGELRLHNESVAVSLVEEEYGSRIWS